MESRFMFSIYVAKRQPRLDFTPRGGAVCSIIAGLR
jgi:hypothetical protein